MLFPAAEVTRLLSNLIKYQFVNLKPQDSVLIDPEKNAEKFVPLKKDSRVKIRSLEEVEEEERERAVIKKEEEGGFSPGISVSEMNEELEKKREKMQKQSEELLEDARKQAEEIVARAEEEAGAIREAARTEGMDAGRQEGLAQAEKEAEEIRQDLEEASRRLQAEYEQMVRQVEPNYVDILCSLIQKLTGVLMTDNKDVLLHLFGSGIADMDPSTRYTIRVSPEDVMTVESCRRQLAKEAGHVTIDIQEEKGLAKDECIIETERQMVDCGFKTQLGNLLTTLRMLVQN